MTASLVLPSFYDVMPHDLGGVYARQGFAYQDEVAARYYVEMLTDEKLVEVWCETHDDISLVWKFDGPQIIEFVQVKAENPDQLWTIAKLCERPKFKPKPAIAGNSILEKSLARDRCSELSWFRIVTCRQLTSDLIVLTYKREHEHRSMSYAQFSKLTKQVEEKIGALKSAKGNGAHYWLTNACWEVITKADISTLNQKALADALYALEQPYDPDTVRSIYTNLLTLAKNTAEFGVDKLKEKGISRNQLLTKISDWIQPYPNKVKSERLKEKLTTAGLDSICINVAQDQQRFYLNKRRTSPYLATEQTSDIEHQVLDALHNLRTSLDSGSLEENGVRFHEQCLKVVRELLPVISDARALPPGYLSGCMYEITARCRHRFTRLRP